MCNAAAMEALPLAGCSAWGFGLSVFWCLVLVCTQGFIGCFQDTGNDALRKGSDDEEVKRRTDDNNDDDLAGTTTMAILAIEVANVFASFKFFHSRLGALLFVFWRMLGLSDLNRFS